MKITILLLFLSFQTLIFAQKPCEYVVNVSDTLGTLKETKSCLIYEKVSENATELIFLSLISNDGMPVLSLQIIEKSPNFITPKCIDQNSKIYFQLSNGKIFTLINSSENECASLIYNEAEKLNNRLLSAYFLFRKDDFKELKEFPISVMRIKYTSESIDYVLPKELHTEKAEGVFEPEKFFNNYFPCIEN
jgi:hypothetical protein